MTMTRGGQSLPATTGTQAVVTPSGGTTLDGKEIPFASLLDEKNPDRSISPDGVTTHTPNVAQLVVTTTPTLLLAANPNRIGAILRNVGNVAVWIRPDQAALTTNGYPIYPNEPFPTQYTGAWYGQATSGTATIAVYEETSS